MSITIDMPKNIYHVPEIRSREEHAGKVPVLKLILWNDVESYLVDQYSGGISKKKLAEMPGLDIYGGNELLEKYHVKSGISYGRFTRGIDVAEITGEY